MAPRLAAAAARRHRQPAPVQRGRPKRLATGAPAAEPSGCRARTAPILPAVATGPRLVSDCAAPLPAAAARPQLRSHRLLVRVVRTRRGRDPADRLRGGRWRDFASAESVTGRPSGVATRTLGADV